MAVHILTVLAHFQKGGRLVSSEQIAKSVNTNPVVIRNLLRSLKAVGLVESKEGKGGGVRLARAPRRITLDTIFSAVDEADFISENPNSPNPSCFISSNVKDVLRPMVGEAMKAVHKILAKRTLGDVLEECRLNQ